LQQTKQVEIELVELNVSDSIVIVERNVML